jgi:hypothetical protein
LRKSVQSGGGKAPEAKTPAKPAAAKRKTGTRRG